MATPDEVYKTHYQRQHRILGAYLSLHCWHNGYDAVIVDRYTLAHFHELKNFTVTQLSWLKENIHPYFPECVEMQFTSGSKNFGAVALSRIPVPHTFGKGELNAVDRAAFWQTKNFRVVALSEMKRCSAKFTEKDVISFLAMTGVGLTTPMRSLAAPRVRTRPASI